jgi:hypothetical protein
VSTRAESRPANSPSGSEAVSSPSGSQAASSRFASGPAGSRSASGPASYRSASGPARSQPAAVRARAPRCTASSQACRTRIRFGSARRRGPLTAVGIEPPKPTERRERSLGRTDDRATGRLGDWATGRLGDWATGRLGDWATGRLGRRCEHVRAHASWRRSAAEQVVLGRGAHPNRKSVGSVRSPAPPDKPSGDGITPGFPKARLLVRLRAGGRQDPPDQRSEPVGLGQRLSPSPTSHSRERRSALPRDER